MPVGPEDRFNDPERLHVEVRGNVHDEISRRSDGCFKRSLISGSGTKRSSAEEAAIQSICTR